MKFKRTLDDMLGNKKRVHILRTLFRYPGQFTGRHIARLCNSSQASVQAHLKILADNDILKISYVGRSRVFSLNQENILYQPLRELFQVEDKLVPQLESIIKNSVKKDPKLRESLANVSIYGSILTTEARPDSDIDLFLLFKSKSDEAIAEEHFGELDAKIGKLFGNRLHLFTTNMDDLNALKRSNKVIFHSLKSAHLIYGKELEELIRQNAEDTENH